MRLSSLRIPSRGPALRVVAAASVAVILCTAGAAVAEDLQAELERTNEALNEAEDRKGVLTNRISDYDDQISALRSEVAELRAREADLTAKIDEARAQLEAEREELNRLRERLALTMRELSSRLVEIYKSGQPDALSVILDSDGFDDLVTRYSYLDRIQERDATIVDTVRDLRDEAIAIVDRIKANKEALAAHRAELAETRSALEAKQAELDAVRAEQAAMLGQVKVHIQDLEGDLTKIQNKIQAELAAAGASTTTSDPYPSGPILGSGDGSMIWPVDGILTSPFGMRWGRLHAGIDIAAPGGTPIYAAKAGRVVLASWYGGYGNYTCIDHGGGLSTCYGHQSAFATSTGANVGQGELIGYVGTTGSSTGDHLHFEVRVNGNPVDPMGYLS